MDTHREVVLFEDVGVRIIVNQRLQVERVTSLVGQCVMGSLEPLSVVVEVEGQVGEVIDLCRFSTAAAQRPADNVA